MAVVVTGSQGQLGSELCRQLGSRAVGLDLPEFDVTDRTGVLATLADLRPEAVINTAAYTRVDQAEREPELCRAVNAAAVGYLAEACRQLACPLVQISTDYVFGGDASRRTPYLESDVPCPQSVYARTKLEGEKRAAEWERHLIVRTCGLYGSLGPRSAGNFVATMLRLGREKRHLRVVADQWCTPSYVPHVARAIVFLLDRRQVGLYHVVNTGQTTWYDFAKEVFRQVGLAVEVERITTAQYGALAARPAYSVLDTAKYHSLPECPAMPPWQDALSEYLERMGGRGAVLPDRSNSD